MGYEQFRKEIEVRLDENFASPELPTHFDADHHLGWRTRATGPPGRCTVSAGRVRDEPGGTDCARRCDSSATSPVTFFLTAQQTS